MGLGCGCDLSPGLYHSLRSPLTLGFGHCHSAGVPPSQLTLQATPLLSIDSLLAWGYRNFTAHELDENNIATGEIVLPNRRLPCCIFRVMLDDDLSASLYALMNAHDRVALLIG